MNDITKTAVDEQLSLTDVMRIMDVATTLRREREVAQKELDLPQAKANLRERLLETARLTGENVTEAEVDAAIALYFDNVHSYSDPAWGLQVMLAHLYIRCGLTFLVLLMIAIPIAASVAWFAFLGG
ncbi:MAG: hypothetical protein ACI9G1_003135 [Pirellulaceae bacterium]|jgi:hypothetical protein